MNYWLHLLLIPGIALGALGLLTMIDAILHPPRYIAHRVEADPFESAIGAVLFAIGVFLIVVAL